MASRFLSSPNHWAGKAQDRSRINSASAGLSQCPILIHWAAGRQNSAEGKSSCKCRFATKTIKETKKKIDEKTTRNPRILAIRESKRVFGILDSFSGIPAVVDSWESRILGFPKSLKCSNPGILGDINFTRLRYREVWPYCRLGHSRRVGSEGLHGAWTVP